jgi:aldose 1-epimerase
VNESVLWLNYLSKDGENGFPGNLKCKVIYSLNDRNEFRIDYEAETDRTTFINLTNHSYFNLNDGGASSILDHQIQLNAGSYTPVNDHQIPTGEISSVKGTAFDFTEPALIGQKIHEINNYDHNLVIDGRAGELRKCARVFSQKSGRIMEVLTTEPGVQFYTPKELNITGKGRQFYGEWPAFCLETQHFPDSPNRPVFPSTLLKPGERFKSTTIYRFSVSDTSIY